MSEQHASSQKKREDGYLFSVEVLIEGKTNGHALEKLTRLLNQEDVADYRVLKGVNLGMIIQSMIDRQNSIPTEEHLSAALSNDETPRPPILKADKDKDKDKGSVNHEYMPIVEQIERFKEQRTLVRLSVLKGKGVKLSLPCRILNHDWASGNITVYHVDEKKVYSFELNEIDDLTAS